MTCEGVLCLCSCFQGDPAADGLIPVLTGISSVSLLCHDWNHSPNPGGGLAMRLHSRQTRHCKETQQGCAAGGIILIYRKRSHCLCEVVLFSSYLRALYVLSRTKPHSCCQLFPPRASTEATVTRKNLERIPTLSDGW